MIPKSPRITRRPAARRPHDQTLGSSQFDRPAAEWMGRLQEMFEKLGVAVPGERTLGSLGRYLDEVIRWGRKVDLVAPRTPDELLELSFADAIVLFQDEKDRGSARTFIDVGSGGGAPGVPLALLLQEVTGSVFTFVEPRDKRVAFLHHLVGTLGLESARVVRGRSDSVSSTCDVALSRATLPPPLWLAEGGRLAEAVWLLLAREETPEHPALRSETVIDYRWPFQDVPRRAVRFIRKA